MKAFLIAVVLSGLCLACQKESPAPGRNAAEQPKAGPEWSLQGLVEALDRTQWKGEWVSCMLPSPFRTGPAIHGSLVYTWQERKLLLEFVAYQRHEKLKEMPAEQTCQRIAQNVKEALGTESASRLLASVLGSLPHGAIRGEPGGLSEESPGEPKSTAIVKVSVRASPGNNPPYEEMDSCECTLEPAPAGVAGGRDPRP